MRTYQLCPTTVPRILTAALILMLAANGPAAEPGSPSAAPAENAPLAGGDLSGVRLSVIDEKLALSLAVETHVQIELLEYALAEIHNADLEQFTRKKLGLCRALFSTLDTLTDGRARAMLADGASQTGDGEADGHAAASGATVNALTAAGEPQATARKNGGIRSVVRRASDAAILKVRLEIAGQYTDMLRDGLETAIPEEFDRRFLAAETLYHMQVVAMLRVFEQHASHDFARIVRRATTTAEAQLVEGQELGRQLDGDEATPRPRFATAVE